MSPNDNYNYCWQSFMYVSVCMFLCEYVCLSIYVWIIIKTCDKISSSDTLNKQLYMTCGYITISKTNRQRSIDSGGWWNLISFAGEPDQKWFCCNPWNSHSGHQLMNPTTWVTIFNWSLYLQLQNTKLHLSNFTKGIAKLNIKKKTITFYSKYYYYHWYYYSHYYYYTASNAIWQISDMLPSLYI